MPQKHRLKCHKNADLIEGPKWTGKTTTAEQIARSVIKLHDPDMAANYIATADTSVAITMTPGHVEQLISVS